MAGSGFMMRSIVIMQPVSLVFSLFYKTLHSYLSPRLAVYVTKNVHLRLPRYNLNWTWIRDVTCKVYNTKFIEYKRTREIYVSLDTTS